MLNADLQLKNDAAPRKKRRRKAQLEEDEAALHFIAFVPVEGKLWKLDGLQPQPQNLGTSGVRCFALGSLLNLLYRESRKRLLDRASQARDRNSDG